MSLISWARGMRERIVRKSLQLILSGKQASAIKSHLLIRDSSSSSLLLKKKVKTMDSDVKKYVS